MFKFLTDTLAKISQNICAYSFVSENSKDFFLYFEKNTCSFNGGGGGHPSFQHTGRWY